MNLVFQWILKDVMFRRCNSHDKLWLIQAAHLDIACSWEVVMMTSSNGNIFRATGPLCGEFTGHRWITLTRPVTRSFDVFSELRLDKRWNKQSWGWWFGTPSRLLWRQCNGKSYYHMMLCTILNGICHIPCLVGIFGKHKSTIYIYI